MINEIVIDESTVLIFMIHLKNNSEMVMLNDKFPINILAI